MKSKEEMIAIMRYAFQDCLCNADGTTEEAWDAALKALCRALPDFNDKQYTVSDCYPEGFTNKPRAIVAMGYYNQLKQWGKE